MRSLSRFKNRKAQFFILSTLVIVGIIYFVSTWIEPYTILDTSNVVASEDVFIFDNVVDKAREIVYNTGLNSEELKYNLEEYKVFLEDYTLRKNVNIKFDISNINYGNPTTGYIDIVLKSTTHTITKRLVVSRSFSIGGWWKFDEGRGSIASDSSGNGNHGTIYGATWTQSKFGNALSFPGADNYYVEVPYDSTIRVEDGDFTISTWIKGPSSQLAENIYIVSLFDDFGFRVALGGSDNLGIWCRLQDGSTTGFNTNYRVLDNAWHNIVVVRRGNSYYFYDNGEFITSTTMSQSLRVQNTPRRIGAWSSTYGKFNGIIDEVRIWDAALSAEQIYANYLMH